MSFLASVVVLGYLRWSVVLLYHCLEPTEESGSTALHPRSPRRARCVLYGLDRPAEVNPALIGPVLGCWEGCTSCRRKVSTWLNTGGRSRTLTVCNALMEGSLRASSRECSRAKYSHSVSGYFPKFLRRGACLPLPVVGTRVDASDAAVSKRRASQLGESGR